MTGLGVTLVVSGLRLKAPKTWSAVTDQAIWRKEAPSGHDAADKLAKLAEEGISQANWIYLNVGPDATLSCAARFDVVLWVAGGELPSDEDIGRSIGKVTRRVDPMTVVNANWSREPLMGLIDPWTSVFTQGWWHRWPGGWHKIERNDHLAITCTRRALPAVRLWFVASTARYVDVHGGNSLSGLLETDDELPTRGALAEYVGYLALERRDRINGMLISSAADYTDDWVKNAEETAKLREVEANINVTAVYVSAAASRLAASLGSPDSGGWTFLKADDLDIRVSLAKARGNAGRASAIQDRLRVTQQHMDAVAQRAETRANTYATLLLTVVAGAFTGAALVTQRRTAASVAFGGTLFVIGLLVVDAARAYRRIHGLLALAVMAGAGAAGAKAVGTNNVIAAVAVAIGAATGLGLFYLARELQRHHLLRRFVAWLMASPTPASGNRRGRKSKASG
jgi:hypothetical protein